MDQHTAPTTAATPTETPAADSAAEITPPLLTLFTAFGTAPSYLFYVKEKGERADKKLCANDTESQSPSERYWEQIFDKNSGWDSAPLRRYAKPLGERVRFVVSSSPGDTSNLKNLEGWLKDRFLDSCRGLDRVRDKPLLEEWLAERAGTPPDPSNRKKRAVWTRLKKWWCRKEFERCRQNLEEVRALREAVEGAGIAYAEKLKVSLERVEVTFFTPGVAVLILRFKPGCGYKHKQFIDDYFKDGTFEEIVGEDKCINRWDHIIIKSCKTLYKNLMADAAARSAKRFNKLKWTLTPFEPGSHRTRDPSSEFRYPLSFLSEADYDARIEDILAPLARLKEKDKPGGPVESREDRTGGDQVQPPDWLQQILDRVDSLVEGLGSQYERQSSEARVPYRHAEVYVDWSESLVKVRPRSDGEAGDKPRFVSEEDRLGIETNFVVALASWLALFFMNKNSSFFLFEAFLGMVTDKPQSTANTVHERNMAYKDVADASLPIRWTTGRKDLYLLEAIHHNWSSERWRRTIEERMKLLNLHYERLEEEQKGESARRISLFGFILTVAAMASAAAGVIALLYNDTDTFSNPQVLGYKLREIDIYISLMVPIALSFIFFVGLWLWTRQIRWLKLGRKKE
jgi:hypothetical protein